MIEDLTAVLTAGALLLIIFYSQFTHFYLCDILQQLFDPRRLEIFANFDLGWLFMAVIKSLLIIQDLFNVIPISSKV